MKRPGKCRVRRPLSRGIKCICIGLFGILLSCFPQCLFPLSIAILVFGILCLLP